MYNRVYNLSYLIVFTLFLNSGISSTQAQPDVNNILYEAQKHLTNISSIRYSSTLKTVETIQSEDGQENSLKVELIGQTFVYDGGKYRTSLLSSPNSPDCQLWLEMAFNGHLYQELNPAQSSLNVTRKKPAVSYGVLEILTTSYLFAIKPDPNRKFSLEALKQNSVWQSVKKNSTIYSQEEVMGHPCVVIKISYSIIQDQTGEEFKLVHLVVFAKDMNWFPILYESEVNSVIASRWELNEYVTKHVGDSEIIMPLSLKGFALNPDGEIIKTTTLVVQPESVEINKPIPEEIFTISTSKVEIYRDNDLVEDPNK